MNKYKPLTDTLTETLRWLIKNWVEYKHNSYLIKICSLSIDEHSGEFIVKYQLTNKRVCGQSTLKDFLASPLIHYVHPSQMYFLGFDSKEMLTTMIKNDQTPKPPVKSTLARFKRIFFHDKKF